MSTAVSMRLPETPALRSLLRLRQVAEPEPEPEPALVALLVTDLEGFTPLVEALGDDAAHDLIHTHNTIVRSALEHHGGREFAHTGDGLMASFRSVSGALRASTAIQAALSAHSRAHRDQPLRARIGVHAGEPLPEEGRLFGTCLNTAVRVCAAAGAESVLVSELACQLVAGRTFRFHDGGLVALKGLREPVRVRELIWRAG